MFHVFHSYVLAHNHVNDFIISWEFKQKFDNSWHPTSTNDELKIEEFYGNVQEILDESPEGVIPYNIVGWNAIVDCVATFR